MVPFLERKGVVTVIAASDKIREKPADMDNVRIRCLGKKLLGYKLLPFPIKLIPIFLWNLKMVLVLLRSRFDIVWCAGDFLGFLGVYLVSKIRKYRVIFEAIDILSKCHEEQHSGILLKLDRILEKFVVKKADLVLAVSMNPFEFYRVYNTKIELAPYFVDTKLLGSTSRTKTPDSKLIGLVGPFESSNMRAKYCLQFVYSNIENFDSRLRFVAIGRFDRAVQHDRIRFTGYVDSEKDYAEILSRLDALLVVENYSTTGPLTKILECMSCSVPVFATPNAVIGLSWVEPGKDIFVIKEDEMVSKINEKIFDDELMTEIGNNARKVITSYYSKEANEDKYLEILQLVMHP